MAYFVVANKTGQRPLSLSALRPRSTAQPLPAQSSTTPSSMLPWEQPLLPPEPGFGIFRGAGGALSDGKEKQRCLENWGYLDKCLGLYSI